MTTKSPEETGKLPSLFETGRNCWRIEQAEKLSLIVDAADFFTALRHIMIHAKRQLLLIGWDFDFEIEMVPGESDKDGLAPDGLPNTLGAFIEAVVEKTPELQIYILKWNGALLVAPARILPTLKVFVFGSDRINFALDSHHPFGACHHQKIIVADDTFSFCGGIDVTENRWDTRDHAPDDPRRVRRDGSPSEPWHDATAALSGPVAAALGDLSRRRWQRATGDELERPGGSDQNWPASLPVTLRDVKVAIARTEPPYDGEPLINEIELLYLDAISAAKDFIYIESQYFAAETVCDAIEARLLEPGGPEVVVINPQAALAEIEDKAMHVLRGRMIERFQNADPGDRFRIFNPVNAAKQPIYVHAKILVVDDRILRIGSSNLNDRSLGFDTECDVAFEDLDGKKDDIAAYRRQLLGEHLGASVDAITKAEDEAGSIIGAIEELNTPEGRGLQPIVQLPEDMVGGFLADTRLLDPRYKPGEITRAGRGLRPRHVTILAGVAAIGFLCWYIWRRQNDQS